MHPPPPRSTRTYTLLPYTTLFRSQPMDRFTSSMNRNRKLPPLGALRAFEAAARHRSFRRAADELAVTPTAISHQIRLMEDVLGLALRSDERGVGKEGVGTWRSRGSPCH